MKVLDTFYNNWAVLECDKCDDQQHYYVNRKSDMMIPCNCGNKNMDFLDISSWDAGDYMQICYKELDNNGCSQYKSLADGMYDALKATIARDEMFNKVMKDVVNEILTLIPQE